MDDTTVVDNYDHVLRFLLQPPDAYAGQADEDAFGELLFQLRDLPKWAWTKDRIADTLNVLYIFAYADNEPRAPTTYNMLRGVCPAPLLRTHLNNLREAVNHSITTQNYDLFINYPEHLWDIQSWCAQKKKWPVVDPTSWEAVLNPNGPAVDWAKVADPIATLLTLRAVRKDPTAEERQAWWDGMFAHETRHNWSGGLRRAMTAALMQDCAMLRRATISQFEQHAVVDLDLLNILPEIAPRQFDSFGEPKFDAFSDHTWLLFELHHFNVLTPASGDNMTRRRSKEDLIDRYKNNILRIKDTELLTTCVEALWKSGAPVTDMIPAALRQVWKTLVNTHLNEKERDTLQLVYDNIFDLDVMKVYFDQRTHNQPAHAVVLPENLIDEDMQFDV